MTDQLATPVSRERTEQSGPAADNTAPKQHIGRPFEPGQSGNLAGRPKGSRNKLSEAFLEALADDFLTNGKEVIERVRTERPHDYLKVCASMMPKRLESEDITPVKNPREMTDAELEAVLWKYYEALGVTDKDVADAEARLRAEGRDPAGHWRRPKRQ